MGDSSVLRLKYYVSGTTSQVLRLRYCVFSETLYLRRLICDASSAFPLLFQATLASLPLLYLPLLELPCLPLEILLSLIERPTLGLSLRAGTEKVNEQ